MCVIIAHADKGRQASRAPAVAPGPHLYIWAIIDGRDGHQDTAYGSTGGGARGGGGTILILQLYTTSTTWTTARSFLTYCTTINV